MCTSVKNSVTEAFNQHENAQMLSQEASMQTNRWPAVHEAPAHIDDELTKSTGQSLDLKRPLPSDIQMAIPEAVQKDSGDSDSSVDRLPTRRSGPMLSLGKRVRSLPVDNHMSTRNLLSAEHHWESNAAELAELRLDIKP